MDTPAGATSTTGDWPNAFVRARHAAVSTPSAVLESLVRRATGDGLDHVDRIVDGYENEVYRARTDGEQDVVIRIARFGGTRERSAGEARAIELARAAGVPGPEVLLLDTIRIDDGEFPVMVQRAMAGRPLRDVAPELSARQRDRVLTEVGQVMARLQSVRIERPATISAPPTGPQVRRELLLAGGLSAAEFDLIMGWLENADRSPNPESVLCHGDLGPQHVFVDDHHALSGVIDFGDWRAGLPGHDLAVWRVRAPRFPLAPVLAGYGAPASETFRRRLDLRTLPIALVSLEIGVDDEDEACVRRSLALIRGLLDALGKNSPGK
jgi:aminoglycoside phosphotransferase (APT) family kinase protein